MLLHALLLRIALPCLQRQAITDNPEWALQRRRSRATAERSRASLADQSARAGGHCLPSTILLDILFYSALLPCQDLHLTLQCISL